MSQVLKLSSLIPHPWGWHDRPQLNSVAARRGERDLGSKLELSFSGMMGSLGTLYTWGYITVLLLSHFAAHWILSFFLPSYFMVLIASQHISYLFVLSVSSDRNVNFLRMWISCLFCFIFVNIFVEVKQRYRECTNHKWTAWYIFATQIHSDNQHLVIWNETLPAPQKPLHANHS